MLCRHKPQPPPQHTFGGRLASPDFPSVTPSLAWGLKEGVRGKSPYFGINFERIFLVKRPQPAPHRAFFSGLLLKKNSPPPPAPAMEPSELIQPALTSCLLQFFRTPLPQPLLGIFRKKSVVGQGLKTTLLTLPSCRPSHQGASQWQSSRLCKGWGIPQLSPWQSPHPGGGGGLVF